MKWKLFLSEINDYKEAIIKWYKGIGDETNARVFQCSNGIGKLAGFVIKASTPSTAFMSMNISARVDKI